jgi:thioesterase domain-containing protein
VVLKSGSSGKPFFLVHAIIAEHLSYLPLVKRLKIGRPIYGLRLPERDGVALTFGDLQTLARFHVEAICNIQPEGSYYLAGYSFGGGLALEIAQQLIAMGQKVALLAMIEAGPSSRAKRTPYDLCRTFLLFLRNIPYYVVDDLLTTRPTEMFLRVSRKARAIKRRVTSLLKTGRYPAPGTRLEDIFELDDFPESIWKVQEVNFQAARNYVCLPYPDRVILFRARTAPFFHSYERDLGWSSLARGGVRVKVIRGNHLSIIREPYVRELADQLTVSLDEADRRYSTPAV